LVRPMPLISRRASFDWGFLAVEVTSFVSPQWVAQMADQVEVMKGVRRESGVRYPVLVPNLKGLDNALACGVEEIAVFAAASETFSQKNTNCSIAESLDRIAEVVAQAKSKKLRMRGYISCVLGCPYEGDISLDQVTNVAKALHGMGIEEISLGDTIGVGTPLQAQTMLSAVAEHVPLGQLALHFHDTYGQALANIFACLELGVSTIDSSVGGLGGCPYAPGASGNVATEDVIYMLNGLGIEHGVDLEKLMKASDQIHQYLSHPNRSKVAIAKANSD